MGTAIMGYEGKAYLDAAGSTATTELTASRSIGITLDPTKADTTVRPVGASPSPPVMTEQVVKVASSYTIQYLVNASDTQLELLRAAAAAGTPLALRLKDTSAGKGFDGDVTVGTSGGYPLEGEQVEDFTCTPTRESGRAPQLYV
jgi:hypothetical protein